MKIPFMKMSGSGNDFILVDHRKPLLDVKRMKEFAQKVCRRRISVGADGILFIERSEKADFKWRFFNADGSEAEMCGNGGRCAARFAFLKGIAGSSLTFETLAGVLSAQSDWGERFDTIPIMHRAGPMPILLRWRAAHDYPCVPMSEGWKMKLWPVAQGPWLRLLSQPLRGW